MLGFGNKNKPADAPPASSQPTTPVQAPQTPTLPGGMNAGGSPGPAPTQTPTQPTPSPAPAQPTPAPTPLKGGTVVPPNADGSQPTQFAKQIGKYQVSVIREKCISAASCVAIAPKVFDLDEEGLAKVISQDGNDDDTKLLAAQSCPTAAIIVTDTTTGEQVWPR